MNKILERTVIEKEIKKFLLHFNDVHIDRAYKRGVYVFGSAGVGKTHFVTSILNDMGYDIIKYDAGDVRNKSLIDTLTSNNISNNNVLQLMYKVSKKIVIIMDELDGINLGDKGCISALIKIIRQKKTKKQKLEDICVIPIICIGSYYTDKKLKELINICNTYELKPPTRIQTIDLNSWIVPQFNSLPQEIQNNIIDYTTGDLRKIFFFKKICNAKPEILTDIKLLNCILKNKNVNDNAKQLTRLFINNNYSLKLHDTMINDTDRTTTSLLFHENIIDELSYFNNKESVNFYNIFLDNMCFSDYIDKTTFQNQTWIFNEISSIIKIFKNNYLFHTNIINNSNLNKYESGSICKLNEIRFTKILTKYSTEYNNQIFLFNICQKLELDKKDLLLFFYSIKNNNYKNTEIKIEGLTELDINRVYRFLDKNIKNITLYNNIDEFIEYNNTEFNNTGFILEDN